MTRWRFAHLIERAGVLALFLPADPTEGRKGSQIVTHRRQESVVRGREEFHHSRGSRLLSQAIDAQRRLSARQADSTRAKTRPDHGARFPPHIPDAVARLSALPMAQSGICSMHDAQIHHDKPS